MQIINKYYQNILELLSRKRTSSMTSICTDIGSIQYYYRSILLYIIRY